MHDHIQAPDQAEHGNDPQPEIAVDCIIGYNLDEGKGRAGSKVRFKIQIVIGKRAAAADERQAEAIRELLLRTRQHRMQQPPSR